MKITVQVKTNSRKESVEETEDGIFIVRVNAPPIENKANERVIELLAEHLDIPKSSIELVGGHKSKRKIFQY